MHASWHIVAVVHPPLRLVVCNPPLHVSHDNNNNIILDFNKLFRYRCHFGLEKNMTISAVKKKKKKNIFRYIENMLKYSAKRGLMLEVSGSRRQVKTITIYIYITLETIGS